MKVAKILSFFLAMVMLLSVMLVACGDDDGTNNGGGSVIVETEEKDQGKQYDAEIKNLNGHEFRFYSRESTQAHLTSHEIYAEAPNGEKINDAVFQRNAQLAEKYNCSITEEKSKDIAKSVREPLQAGEYVADFLFGTAQNMRSLAAANLLADYSELSNINLQKDWWDKNAQQGLNVGGKVFFITGDAATLDDRAAWIMYFNREFIEQYKEDLNLYDEVRKGNWTIDLMYELVTNTWKEIDGQEGLTANVDRFGYITEGTTSWFHVNACNVTVSRISSSGQFEIPEQPKKDFLDVMEKLRPLLTTQYRLVSDNGTYFRKGLGTFYACNLGTAMNNGSTTIPLGYLPMPKLNAEQDDYYNGVSFAQVGVFAIPTTVDNGEDWETNGFTSGQEQCAYFLDAFAYYSMNILTPAFYDEVLTKQAVRDAESVEMLEIALKNKVYDPVIGYNFGKMLNMFNEVTTPTGVSNSGLPGSDANYDTLVSNYTSKVEAARKALQNYIKYINTEA